MSSKATRDKRFDRMGAISKSIVIRNENIIQEKVSVIFQLLNEVEECRKQNRELKDRF